MRDNEGIFEMNAVLYYSNTGESRRVAEYAAKKLGFKCFDMSETPPRELENAVVVFPVHCQSIPRAVLPVLDGLRAKNLILLVTYGKMSHGNVIYECKSKYGFNIVGAAYIPAKHIYIREDSRFEDFEKLDPVLGKLQSPTAATIPKSFKNPFAGFFPEIRSRIGVKLVKTGKCNECGLCRKICNNEKCIRCLKCAAACPQGAITFELNPFMRAYLGKKKQIELVIYK